MGARLVGGHLRASLYPTVAARNETRIVIYEDANQSVDVGLAALTLLVAESDPAAKDMMTRLIMNMLARNG